MANDYRAVAKELPISAQKTRLVIDLVRGKDVVDALNTLKFISRGNLYVHKIFADEGRTMKRGRFGGRGRYKPRLRRSSHVTVILRERDEN
jgi:large subunit ribosomal protein L22